MPVVCPTRGVLVQEPLDRGGPEPTAFARPVVEQELARQLAQVLAEPAREWDAEAALATLGDGPGQVVREGAAERDLARASALLERRRQREPELDDAMVEERRPQLERVRH